MSKKPYNLYTTEDFLLDSDFNRFVRFRDFEDLRFWDTWRNTNPENADAFYNAEIQLMIIFSAGEKAVPFGFKDQLLNAINDSINVFERSKRQRKLRWLTGVGIACTLTLAGFGAWFFSSTITVETGFSVRKSINLPDGSKVELNANSVLSYPRALRWKDKREIILQGEAYFSVNHLNANKSRVKAGEWFVVHTKGVDVSVLGTEFNLKQRREITTVSLIKGSVKVSNLKDTEALMKPGEVLVIGADGRLSSSQQHASAKTAWISGKLILKQTTVNEIIADFSDMYGYKVVLDNPALGTRKIDGAISLNNEQNLLFTLKNILSVDIVKDGNTIYLKSRE